MQFEFATAQRIVFGPGKLAELPNLLDGLGKKAALVCGSRTEPVQELLGRSGVDSVLLHIISEPTVGQLETLSQHARAQHCEFVVAIGGGSVLDAGKALAALLTNTRNPLDYLEVIGKGEPLDHSPAPCIAIPTTAGTGSEVTRNAVLLSEEHRVKVSLRHPKMLPTVALVDPELTLSVPESITASTGLDAFTQLLESFVSRKANPLTDGLCREGLKHVVQSLQRAYFHGNDLDARTGMAFGSLCSGLALANAGLGAVHGFAGPIGGMFKAPHGMVCASLLPAVYEANLQALQQRDPENPAIEKYRQAAAIVTGRTEAAPDDALTWIRECTTEMMVPGLAEFGIREGDFPSIVENAKRASSMKGNPIQLTDTELMHILEESLTPPTDGNATLYI